MIAVKKELIVEKRTIGRPRKEEVNHPKVNYDTKKRITTPKAPPKPSTQKSKIDYKEVKTDNFKSMLRDCGIKAGFFVNDMFGTDIFILLPITRHINVVLNKDGFNPLTKVEEDNSIKIFAIDLCSEKDYQKIPRESLVKGELLKSKHVNYVRHFNIQTLTDLIRNSL